MQPGEKTAQRLREVSDWLEKRETALRSLAAHRPGTAQQAFAANLIRRRKAAGLTQTQLAERAGVTQAHISKLERGEWEPRLNTIVTLAKALGVKMAELLPPEDENT